MQCQDTVPKKLFLSHYLSRSHRVVPRWLFGRCTLTRSTPALRAELCSEKTPAKLPYTRGHMLVRDGLLLHAMAARQPPLRSAIVLRFKVTAEGCPRTGNFTGEGPRGSRFSAGCTRTLNSAFIGTIAGRQFAVSKRTGGNSCLAYWNRNRAIRTAKQDEY